MSAFVRAPTLLVGGVGGRFQFYARCALVELSYDYFCEVGEDMDVFARKFPPSRDPFYDPPRQRLLGVAVVYLDAVR